VQHNFGHNNLSKICSDCDVECNNLHMISAVIFLSEFLVVFICNAVFCWS
jgi:hypothetical protein